MAYLISICPDCEEENFPEALFCINCGNSLLDIPLTKINPRTGTKEHIKRHRSVRKCPECDWDNPGSFNVCGKCNYNFDTKAIQQEQSRVESKQIEDTRQTEPEDSTIQTVTTPIKKSHSLRNKMFVAAIIASFIFFGPVSDFFLVTSSGVTSSEDIKDIAENSGFSYKGKILFYRSNPELVNADTLNGKCPNTDETVIEYGCYLPSENKMYILQVTDSSFKDIEYTTAAHETLHAAWRQYGSAERQRIATMLKELYDDPSNPSSSKLHETLKTYGEEKNVIDGELHSFIGSEVGGSDLSQPLTEYYAKYFYDQSVPVSANFRFTDKFTSRIASINAESTRLDNMAGTIRTYKRQHLDNIEAAMKRANYYGDVYSYNKNVDAFNHNRIYYNDQIALLDKGIDAYNADIAAYNAMLRAFYPTQASLTTKQSTQPSER